MTPYYKTDIIGKADKTDKSPVPQHPDTLLRATTVPDILKTQNIRLPASRGFFPRKSAVLSFPISPAVIPEIPDSVPL